MMIWGTKALVLCFFGDGVDFKNITSSFEIMSSMNYHLAHASEHKVAARRSSSAIARLAVILRPRLEISQYCAASTYIRAPRHANKAKQARAPRHANILIHKSTCPKTVNSDAPYSDVRLYDAVLVVLSPPGAIAALS